MIFTEHRDTLRYLQERITTLLGRQTSVIVIHGSVDSEERLAAQEAFRHDPQVQVLRSGRTALPCISARSWSVPFHARHFRPLTSSRLRLRLRLVAV